MKFDASAASFLLAFIGALSGWIAWWHNKLKFEKQQATQIAVAAAEKALNDKRNFDHLVRNQAEISKNIAYGFQDIENQIADQNNELREIKAWLIRCKPAE
ncbi:MAG: hypothetical protein RM049_30760 [Nostoc sp. DedQUE04]|uniref:hypothetical protein n=1 Tax=Nostoc sp. DedQUE04 TaxID=3075390 RepID=UPI002AD5063A|nr:hypothetical protein [Nostoc sp. DedQUE04]MDZ8139622.1 hypothetical protein [Nostoc sp. DedQUE04]